MNPREKLLALINTINSATGVRWTYREMADLADVNRVTLDSWLRQPNQSSYQRMSERNWRYICWAYHARFGKWPNGCEACLSAARG